MSKVRYINPLGKYVEFGMLPPYTLESLDGTGNAPAEFKTLEPAYMDGEIAQGVRIGSRPMKLKATIWGSTMKDLDTKKEATAGIINPALGIGRLIYTNNAGQYEIICAPDSTPKWADEYRGNTQGLEVSFTAYAPHWLAVDSTVLRMALAEKAFKFPLVLPTRFGRRGYIASVTNRGHVVAPIVVTFGGSADHPRITNKTTGEFIQLDTVLNGTKAVRISTVPNEKTVDLTDTDTGAVTKAMGLVTYGSTFFSMVPGINEMVYESNDNSLPTTVEISFRARFLGV